MKKYKRIFTIVIDSLGIGAMANAAEYGDAGTDTLGHIDERMKEFRIPNLAKLGLADLHPMIHVLCPFIGSQCGKGYHDRPLGDDGTSDHEAISDIYRYWIS